jgi:hypothetical protein
VTAPEAGGDAGSGATGEGTVGDVAALYLGNILYALELAALSLEDRGRREDAGFYRGIARRLAEARGREKGAGG